MLLTLLACANAAPGASPLRADPPEPRDTAPRDAATGDTARDTATDAAVLSLGVLGPAALAGCAPARFVLAGGTVVGVGRADVEIDAGRIVAVGTVADDAPLQTRLLDLAGRRP